MKTRETRFDPEGENPFPVVNLIEEGNKLIAEFMGKPWPSFTHIEQALKFAPYHSSWNWLMPVVEKIFKMEHLDLGYDTFKSEEALIIQDYLKSSNLLKTWEATVNFIKYFNPQKSIDMEDFKFGVLDYSKTYQNHKSKLARYRASCDKTPSLTPSLKYDWTRDETAAYHKTKTPAGWVGVILARHSWTASMRCANKRSIRTLVNGFFFGHIKQYLKGADLPASWVTAVYLDCYDELNEYMNEVANIILEEV